MTDPWVPTRAQETVRADEALWLLGAIKRICDSAEEPEVAEITHASAVSQIRHLLFQHGVEG